MMHNQPITANMNANPNEDSHKPMANADPDNTKMNRRRLDTKQTLAKKKKKVDILIAG